MILYLCMGILAAVGGLFLLWLLIGCFLPKKRQGSVAVSCQAEDLYVVLRRYRWMRELGLTRFTLVIIPMGISQEQVQGVQENYPGVTFMTKEQWLKE